MQEDLFSHIISSELQSKVLLVKILFLLISLFLSGFIIWLLRKTEWLKYWFGQDLVEFRSFKAFEAVSFVKRWERIKRRLRKDWEPELKLSIIEADQLLDDLLKRMGYTGESLGERLKKLNSNILPNIDEIFKAHKIRNNVIHDPDYKLSLSKTKEVIKIYEETFQNLEAL